MVTVTVRGNDLKYEHIGNYKEGDGQENGRLNDSVVYKENGSHYMVPLMGYVSIRLV